MDLPFLNEIREIVVHGLLKVSLRKSAVVGFHVCFGEPFVLIGDFAGDGQAGFGYAFTVQGEPFAFDALPVAVAVRIGCLDAADAFPFDEAIVLEIAEERALAGLLMLSAQINTIQQADTAAPG